MTEEEISKGLKLIREELDKKPDSSDIIAVQTNLINLQALSGLCAEIIKESEINLYSKQTDAIANTEKRTIPVFEKIIQGKLALEVATLNYAKNLFKALENKNSALRTIVSLYKTEMEVQLKK